MDERHSATGRDTHQLKLCQIFLLSLSSFIALTSGEECLSHRSCILEKNKIYK